MSLSNKPANSLARPHKSFKGLRKSCISLKGTIEHGRTGHSFHLTAFILQIVFCGVRQVWEFYDLDLRQREQTTLIKKSHLAKKVSLQSLYHCFTDMCTILNPTLDLPISIVVTSNKQACKNFLLCGMFNSVLDCKVGFLLVDLDLQTMQMFLTD